MEQEQGRFLPRSKRGKSTRESLIRAARQVFERDGFTSARVSDIADTAEVAVGSFYTYFSTKEEIFTAVLRQLNQEMLHPQVGADTGGHADLAAQIEAMNRAYLLAYRKNAKIMAVLEEVALVNEDVRRWRIERSRVFSQRNARNIRRWQARGLADPDLDPMVTARALSGMVGRLAEFVFIFGDRIPFETLVTTLTRLWVNALQIPPDARDDRPGPPGS